MRGLVPIRDLADDYYDFDERNYALVGRRSKTRYTLGDRVRVQVARANVERKMVDFALVDDKGRPMGADKESGPTVKEVLSGKSKGKKSRKSLRQPRSRRRK